MDSGTTTPSTTEKPGGHSIDNNGDSPGTIDDRQTLHEISDFIGKSAAQVAHLDKMLEHFTPNKTHPKQQVILTPEPESVRETEKNDSMLALFESMQLMQAQMQALIQENSDLKRAAQQKHNDTHTDTHTDADTYTNTNTNTNTHINTNTDTHTYANTHTIKLPSTPPQRPAVMQSVTPQHIPAHRMPEIPKILSASDDAIFIQLENLNAVKNADPQQAVDTQMRSTCDYFSLYEEFKKQNRGGTFGIDFSQSGGPALHSVVDQFQNGLIQNNHPNPFSKTIITLRHFISCNNKGTRMVTLETIDEYVATHHEDVQGLMENITAGAPRNTSLTPPSTLSGTPGLQRLSSTHNLNYVECAQELLDMVIWRVAAAQSSVGTEPSARLAYERTRPGSTYMDTVSNLNDTYTDWCRAAGDRFCSTDKDRTNHLLRLMAELRRDTKLTDKYIRKLQSLHLTHTPLTYERAEGIIRKQALDLHEYEQQQRSFDPTYLLAAQAAQTVAMFCTQAPVLQPQVFPQYQALVDPAAPAAPPQLAPTAAAALAATSCEICGNTGSWGVPNRKKFWFF